MIYRNFVNGRFESFEIKYKYSNMLVHYCDSMTEPVMLKEIILQKLEEIYVHLEDFIRFNPQFARDYSPWNIDSGYNVIDRMIHASKIAGVGPMASIAGSIADELLYEISSHVKEAVIENGGDIALNIIEPCRVSIYLGWRSNHSSLILNIPAGKWGLASSSAKYGHSFSLGKAEMVTVVAGDGTAADALATSICNKIKPGEDPEQVIESFYSDLTSVTIFWNGRIWHRGAIEIDIN